MTKRIIIFLPLILLLSACALQPYGIIYTQITQGDAYPRPWVHSELDLKKMTLIGSAHGESCSTNVLGLVATGDGGIDAALQDAKTRAGGATILYDVRIDRRMKIYFGLYSTFCTEVSGIAAR